MMKTQSIKIKGVVSGITRLFIPRFLAGFFCLISFLVASNEVPPLRIAVASNFTPVINEVLKSFTQQTQIPTQVITASSGALYQQIKHGAPFDIFLSADSIRPTKLVEENLAFPNSQTTYAYGLLALWSASNSINALEPLRNLKVQSRRLGIANPAYAPYGIAAKELLTQLKLWNNIHPHLVMGININQTFLQVRSQSIPLGIVALSQLKMNQLDGYAIPQDLYTPIEQQLVILTRTQHHESAKQLKTFLLSPQVQQKLPHWGYGPHNHLSLPKSVNR